MLSEKYLPFCLGLSVLKPFPKIIVSNPIVITWYQVLFMVAINIQILGCDGIPGARPTYNISIDFEIRPKFAVYWFKIYYTNHNKILHTSRQCNCRDVCKISLWSIMYILN